MKNITYIPKLDSPIGKVNTITMTNTQFVRVVMATPWVGKISELYNQIIGPSEVPNPS